MSDISKSSITTDAEFEKQVAGADFETIKVLMADRAVQQGLVQRDQFDPNVLVATEMTATPQNFARAVTINGTKHVVEADNDLALEKAVGDLYRAQLQPAATESREVQQRHDRGRFTADQGKVDEAEAFRRSELELKFKRGEIDTADYLVATGAIERHLESQGISVDALRDASNQKFTQSWRKSTEEFLQSDAGRDWPGGQENLKIAGRILEENGLVDSPSAETLAAVYRHMKENGLLVQNAELTAHQRINEATSFEEIREVGSSLFGR